ncbi:ABC transporter ATP-binding protein [Microcoleus sp. FACHB-SPT15]|uniref:ABC transporter ATP-binding protein n=1 Tax=Microcoleus sp. FACHB-SPT15 TaxID=2692830 RepID=UPI00177E0EFA|nr:ABC transporter ATP-binding protein [Microcoleus sp. FACHB-SPT15]MBD1806031.1 ABC transporter ATP-binding protein [Microcoleus sp. FACHB-SPT15]
MTDTVLDVRNLQVEFPTDERRVIAVDGIDFTLNRGQTLGIVGESGSGKSVTSLAVMGLVPTPGRISKGEIYFRPSADGAKPVNLVRLSAEQKRLYRGGQISMIFQEPMSSLNPVYTCGFQLTEAILQHQNVSPAEARRQATAGLQEVRLLPSDGQLREQYVEEFHRENPGKPLPGEKEINHQINQQKLAMLDRYPHELSGGQLQRMMIAMAISCNPEVLIADEPTTALDVTVQATILDLLRELRDKRGMSIIFITHDLGVIAEIADSVAVMYQGKIVESGDVWQIFSNPQHPYTKGLLACRPQLEGDRKYLPTVSDFMEVVRTPTGDLQIREKATDFKVAISNVLDNNGSSNEAQPQRAVEVRSQSPLVEVCNLQVGFPVRGVFGRAKRYIMAVNNVSFEVYPGETLGLVGESGCGKSTLARTLLRLIEPMNGEMLFEGQNITKISGKHLRHLRREMQIIFQNPFSSLDPRLKIGEAVMEPLLIHDSGGNSKGRRDRTAYLLERVGLNPDWMNRYPHEFSGGQRQRVAIARALALNPKFIICDESVSALDVSVQAQVLNLLKELQGEFGLTYIFISHDLSVVKFMSDRIMVMNQGKIEEIGSPESIYRKPEKDYTRQLIASIPTGSLERIQQQQEGRRIAAQLSTISDPWAVN